MIFILHVIQHRIADIENGLGASVIRFQFDDPAAGESRRKFHNIPVRTPPKGVNRLGVITHNQDIPVVLGQVVSDIPL